MRAVITWEQLLLYVAILLGVYYAVILLLFYRKEVQELAVKKPRSLQPFMAAGRETPVGEPSGQDAALYHQVLELMEDCKPVFQAAAQQSLTKEQVVASLQVRVQQYPPIRGTAFQISMTNHIAQELDHRLGIVLTEEDAEMLWR